MSTELIPGVHATRFELLMLKRRLRLAQRGHDLLVEKRDALLLHFFNFIRDIGPLRTKLNKALEEAYLNFLRTQISLGTGKLEGVALTVPDRFEVNEKTRNIIGVTLPILEPNIKQKPESGWWYNLTETPAALDEAVLSFEKVLRMVVKLAETETAVKRLAEAITMTKRRVNALESILIPRFQNTIRFIQLSLEERAREDFFRLKRIKKLHEEAEAESALALA